MSFCNLRKSLAAVGMMAGLTGAAYAQAPLTLFNGSSMLGWNAHGSWSVASPAMVTSGAGARNVVTAVPFADLSLQFEYNESGPMGAKLRLWTTAEDSGGLTVDLDSPSPPWGLGGIELLAKSSVAGTAAGWHRVQVDASHGALNIHVDGLPAGSASGLGARGGYLGFEASGNGTLQIRNIRLTPLNASNMFDGTDLSGWKSIARSPASKGGVGHTMEKTLTFGLGGGDTKPHEAKWNVRSGEIHGESGPGGLENNTQFQDGILQINASVKGNVKPDNFPALSVRSVAGKLDGGYGVGVGSYAGNIEHLVKRPATNVATNVDETVVVAGRTFAIWVAGSLTTLHTDTRADNSSGALGAKTGAGAVTLVLPEGGQQIDVQRLTMSVLPKTYGIAAKAPAQAAPIAVPVNVPATAAVPAASPAETALIQQQQTAAQKDAEDRANKQRTASLMSHALSTTDPQQQMADYGQVVQLDPSNAAAVQGFKDAQAKVQSQQAAQQNAVSTEASQQHDAETRAEQTNDSLVKAQSAFLAGHLGDASSALSVAERLSPGNPIAHDLRMRIGSAQSLRSRLYMLGGGAGILSLAGLLAVWLRRRKQQRYPALEMTRGLETGRVYSLDKDIIHIGAVPQDGGQRNDIVVQDVVHAISRFHCEIVRKNGQLYVNDLKSSNGTRLNGELLHPGRPELLRRGDRITLAGDVELRFGYGRRESSKS